MARDRFRDVQKGKAGSPVEQDRNAHGSWRSAVADEILEAQRGEIREMEWLIADIRANGVAHTDAEAAVRPVPPFPGSRK